MNENDYYGQLLSLITGGQQTPADQQAAPPKQDWLQWLINARSGGPGGGASGGGGGLSGMGTALMKLAGGGAAAGGMAGGMGGMLGGL